MPTPCPICSEALDLSGLSEHLRQSHVGVGRRNHWLCGRCDFAAPSLDAAARHCLQRKHPARGLRYVAEEDEKLLAAIVELQEALDRPDSLGTDSKASGFGRATLQAHETEICKTEAYKPIEDAMISPEGPASEHEAPQGLPLQQAETPSPVAPAQKIHQEELNSSFPDQMTDPGSGMHSSPLRSSSKMLEPTEESNESSTWDVAFGNMSNEAEAFEPEKASDSKGSALETLDSEVVFDAEEEPKGTPNFHPQPPFFYAEPPIKGQSWRRLGSFGSLAEGRAALKGTGFHAAAQSHTISGRTTLAYACSWGRLKKTREEVRLGLRNAEVCLARRRLVQESGTAEVELSENDRRHCHTEEEMLRNCRSAPLRDVQSQAQSRGEASGRTTAVGHEEPSALTLEEEPPQFTRLPANRRFEQVAAEGRLYTRHKTNRHTLVYRCNKRDGSSAATRGVRPFGPCHAKVTLDKEFRYIRGDWKAHTCVQSGVAERLRYQALVKAEVKRRQAAGEPVTGRSVVDEALRGVPQSDMDACGFNRHVAKNFVYTCTRPVKKATLFVKPPPPDLTLNNS